MPWPRCSMLRARCGRLAILLVGAAIPSCLEDLPPPLPSTTAPSTPDAAADAATADADANANADAARFCESTTPAPSFCSDFDTEPFANEWPSPLRLETAGGVVGPEVFTPRSPPRSLLASTPALELPPVGRARVCRRFPRPSEAHLAADVRIDALGTSAKAALMSIRFLNDGGMPLFLLDIGHRATTLSLIQTDADSALDFPTPFTRAPSIGTWSRLGLDAILLPVDGGSSFTVSTQGQLDGQVVAAMTHDWPATSGECEICIGIVFAESPSLPWKVAFDNVVVDVRP